MRWLGAVPVLLTLPAAAAEPVLLPYVVEGDAINRSLTGQPGDPARGEALVKDRRRGLCLLCHSGPYATHEQGTLAPDLTGVGSRLTEGQLRLRLVDIKRLNPESLMPAFYRVEGLSRVGESWAGQPVLTAAEIEDVVAYLATLRE